MFIKRGIFAPASSLFNFCRMALLMFGPSDDILKNLLRGNFLSLMKTSNFSAQLLIRLDQKIKNPNNSILFHRPVSSFDLFGAIPYVRQVARLSGTTLASDMLPEHRELKNLLISLHTTKWHITLNHLQCP